MAVRTMRVICPVRGTASEIAGMIMRAMYAPKFLPGSGSMPDAGSRCRFDENRSIRSTASQNDGVASPAMERSLISWSGHLSL